MPAALEFPPRLLTAKQAAHYLGCSTSMLFTLGLPRVELGAKRLYDRLVLDRFADGLPTDGEEPESFERENTCDEAFGIRSA